MKKKISILFLAVVLFVGSAWAGQAADPDYWVNTCVGWNRDSDYVRLGFVHGWLRGIEAADRVTSEVILHNLWPTGWRIGAVVIEIDVYCRRTENRNLEVAEIIQRVAREKNK